MAGEIALGIIVVVGVILLLFGGLIWFVNSLGDNPFR